ncbi:MAG TPA: clan AA aspartic protease [Phycisphaerae bacterium]
MNGKVNARREAILPIHIRGGTKHPRRFLAVIDTGFTGFLTLPLRTIRALRMPRVGSVAAKLADGKVVQMGVYVGLIRWNNLELPVRINAADTDPLIGMALLNGHELRIAVRRNGEVSIREL